MWISKSTGYELEIKSTTPLGAMMGILLAIFGVLVLLGSSTMGFAGYLFGFFFLAAGYWLLSVPHEIIALFDKRQGKLIVKKKIALFSKEEAYALDEIMGIRVVHVRIYKQSHDELRLMLKSGKTIVLMSGAYRLETKGNADSLGAYLHLQVEETTENH